MRTNTDNTLSIDARLIAICHQLDALQAEFVELFSRRTTVEMERATADEMDELYARRDELLGAIEATPVPRTLAGVIAAARAALVTHDERDQDGNLEPHDASHGLMIKVCEGLIRQAG